MAEKFYIILKDLMQLTGKIVGALGDYYKVIKVLKFKSPVNWQ